MPVVARTRRPIVGVPTQTLQSLGGVSAEIPPSWVMSQRYVLTLTNAGAIPWLIPLVDDETLRGVYDALDAVFLPGGAERDRVELGLARWAIDDGKPILGVCRGMQLINLAAGGTLFQDIAEQMPESIKHDYFPFSGQHFTRDYLAHEVSVVPGTRLAGVFGAGSLRVNSMHHQGVRDIGDGLVVSATAPDGLVEALESNDGQYVVGVQWHPEALTDSQSAARQLFDEFVQIAAAAAESHHHVRLP